MKRLLAAFISVAAVVSCAPAAYYISVDKRVASDAGIDLGGKSMSVVYLESEDGVDSLLNNRISDAIALGLENEYFGDDVAIDVLKMKKDPSGDYMSRDSMVNLVMTVGTDVVFLVDTPEMRGKDSEGKLLVRSRVYGYDSMGKDSVVVLSSNYKLNSMEDVGKAISVGANLSKPLRNNWQREDFIVIYFESLQWLSALEDADEFKWDAAIEKWMDIATKSANSQQRSCAMYNIAVGCYAMGESELALEWLDQSDKTYVVSPLTSDLRRRIEASISSR